MRRARAVRLSTPVALVSVAAVYWATAVLSLRVALVGQVVTPIWPPTGIALVALLLLGRRVWPGIALGAFLVNLRAAPTIPAAAAIAAGNTLAPLLAAALLRRLGFETHVARLRDAVWFVVVGVVCMTVSATVGTTALALAHAVGPRTLEETWSVWWAGDTTGVLLFAPLLLSLGRQPETPPGGRAEAAVLAVVLVAASAAVFSVEASLPFAVFPLLVWAAVRFGLRGGSLATVAAAAFAIRAAVGDFGPFRGVGLADQMLSLQGFMAAAALTSLTLAAAAAERSRSARALRWAAEELERRVQERTAALVEANDRLVTEVAARQQAQEEAEQKERQLAEAERIAQTGSWEWDIAGGCVRWSDEMYRIYGHEPQSFPVAFEGTETKQTHPEDKEAITRALRERMRDPAAEGSPFEYRIIRPDGEERRVVGKGEVILGPGGAPVRLVGTIQDVTDQRRAQEALRASEEQFTQFFDLSVDLMLVAGFDGLVRRANPAFGQLLGWSPEELQGRPYLDYVHPDDRELVRRSVEAMVGGGGTGDLDVRILCRDGSPRWFRCSAAFTNERGLIYVVAVDVSERRRAAELLQESEERYRGLVEHAPEAILVVDVDTGRYVDANAEAERLFGLARENLYRVGPSDMSPERQPDGLPSAESAAKKIEQALMGQTPRFEWMHVDAGGREVLCEVRLLHFPSEGRRLVRGSIVDITEHRRAERALEEVAERERALRQQQEIAQTLQSSLLPEGIPDVPGLALAARYLPGSAGLEVGGDWYDVFPLPGGAVGLAIGDIVGRGLRAAAAMGQMRTALRAYALEGTSPVATMTRLGALARTLPEAEMATLIYAVYQPDAGVLSFVSAGHPPPLLVGSDGRTTYLEGGRSVPLGVSGQPVDETMVALEPGSSLILYTDGLVERRGRPLDDGLAALAQAAAAQVRNGPEEVCDAVMRAMVGEESPPDDVALMVLSLDRRHPERFRFSAPADPQHLSALRRSFSRWVTEAGASTQEARDLVLALSEAAANAVLHAYGPADGRFEVDAASDDGLVVVRVRDQGRWRTRGPGQGGRGIRLMEALVDAANIVSGSSGTEVRLERRLGRPPAEQAAPAGLDVGPTDPWADEDVRDDGVAVVRLAGDMDLSTAEAMAAELAGAVSSEHLGLVADLSSVAHLDSSGIRLLFRLERRLERRRQQLRVVAPPECPARRVLEIAGVWTGGQVAETVQDAVASIRDHPV